MLWSLLRLMLSLIFVLPGNWMTYPLTLFIGSYVERERIKALKNSVVKVKAQDVSASLKIFTYICLYPFYLAFFCCLFYSVLRMVTSALACSFFLSPSVFFDFAISDSFESGADGASLAF